MTLEEAKAKLLAAGWPATHEPTTEALKMAGWEPGSILGDIPTPTAVYTPEQMKDGAARLVAEAQANQVSAQVLGYIKQFVGVALTFAK